MWGKRHSRLQRTPDGSPLHENPARRSLSCYPLAARSKSWQDCCPYQPGCLEEGALSARLKREAKRFSAGAQRSSLSSRALRISRRWSRFSRRSLILCPYSCSVIPPSAAAPCWRPPGPPPRSRSRSRPSPRPPRCPPPRPSLSLPLSMAPFPFSLRPTLLVATTGAPLAPEATESSLRNRYSPKRLVEGRLSEVRVQRGLPVGRFHLALYIVRLYATPTKY